MRKLWLDLTTNVQTGHYIALDVFKAVSFAVGIGLIVDAQVYGRSVELGVTHLALVKSLIQNLTGMGRGVLPVESQ